MSRPTDNLTLRPAANTDLPAIKGVVFGVLSEYGLKPDPVSTDSDLDDLQASYFSAGGRFDVLVDSAGAVMGTVGLFRIDDSTFELRKMYLHRDCRGQGWGRRMLEHALAQARSLRARRITLETASVLKEAIALYVRYGFKPFTPEHLAGRCDQAYELILEGT